MRKTVFVILIAVALVSVSGVAYLWVNSLVQSIYGYRTPLKGMPSLTEISSPPLTSQVVLVVIDGLRYDTSFQMPYLNHLRDQGAHASLVSSPPSGAQIAWTTLVSGAQPEINDASLFDQSYQWIRPIAVDHLFAALHRAGFTSGIVGFHWWEKLVPPELLHVKYYVATDDAAADALVIDRAGAFLKEFYPNLLVVNLRHVNTAAQEHGALSAEYSEAVSLCDEHIRLLSASMDLQRSTLAVVSSHGHLDQGGHGGAEPVTLHTPFVLIGESVRAGDHGLLAQTDVAPTIAALLGAPIPSSAQGSIRTDMVRMDRVHQAHILVALADQRSRMANMYLYSIGEQAPGNSTERDVLVAQSSLQVKNYDSALGLAKIAVDQITQQGAGLRASRISKERNQRAVPVALVLLVPLWIMWRKRSWQLVWSAAAALVAASGYHALYVNQGGVYSFSRVPAEGLEAMITVNLRHAGLSLTAGSLIVVWQLWRDRERSLGSAILRTYRHAGLQLYFVGLAVSACTLWNGPVFTWYIADLTLGYAHCTLLLQAMLVAALAIPLPIVIVALQKGLISVSDRFERHGAPKGEPGKPRRHTCVSS